MQWIWTWFGRKPNLEVWRGRPFSPGVDLGLLPDVDRRPVQRRIAMGVRPPAGGLRDLQPPLPGEPPEFFRPHAGKSPALPRVQLDFVAAGGSLEGEPGSASGIGG